MGELGLGDAAGVVAGGVSLGLWGALGSGVSRVGGRMRMGGGAFGEAGSGIGVGTCLWGCRELGVSCTSFLALVGGDGGALVGEARLPTVGTQQATAGLVGVAVATVGTHLCRVAPPCSTRAQMVHARALCKDSQARGGIQPRWKRFK